MPTIDVRVLRDLPDGVEVGSEPCACGACRPTATIFRDDAGYERHDPALAQGPCCCDRFFVVGPEAEERAPRWRPSGAEWTRTPLSGTSSPSRGAGART